MSNIAYWNGVKIRYIGTSTKLYGAVFLLLPVLEGPRKGQTGMTQRAPVRS